MEPLNSDRPSPFEKLSQKFILDEIRHHKNSHCETETTTTQLEDEQDIAANIVLDDIEHLPTHHIDSEDGALTPVALPPDKKYFRIGEVSELVGVEAYVIRYWESEFKKVKPVKSSSNHRVYARKDVLLLLKIRQLLHVEKFSIQGAKRALSNQVKEQSVMSAPRSADSLKTISAELKSLIHLIKSL